ncbi:MAG: hypothetical protein R2909_23685 [Gemmatimonadales bacterium]
MEFLRQTLDAFAAREGERRRPDPPLLPAPPDRAVVAMRVLEREATR